MKKLMFCLVTACLSIALLPNELKASPDSLKTRSVAEVIETQLLVNRLEEIKAIDRSQLSKSEKRALRKEVRSIDKKLRGFSGGIYISAGALIVILILLVLLT